MKQPDWETAPEGIVLPVQVQPKSRRNAVLGIRQGRLLVAVTAAPEHGKANDAVFEVLAEFLKLKRRQISLLTGATSPRKRFLISDASLAALRERVEILPGGLR
jgi:uncharacterized protein